MNKKIIYSLVLTSIFIMSIATVCIQPAAGANWKFGVPKEAIGMKLQSEVKAYDKDLWGDCIGLDTDDRAALAMGTYSKGFSYDGNNVGARSQSEINDWESGDWWFMGDTLLWTKMDESIRNDPYYDRDNDKKSELQTYWDAVEFAEKTVAGFAGRADTVGTGYYSPLIAKVYAEAAAKFPGTGNFTNIQTVQLLATASTYSKALVSAIFHKTYDAKILERDIWYWEKTAEFDDADEEDVATPFIENPEDFFDSWVYFVAMTEELFKQIQTIISAYDAFIYELGGYAQMNQVDGDGSHWDLLNATLYPYFYGAYLSNPTKYAQLWGAIVGSANDAPYGLYYYTKSSLNGLVSFFRGKVPDRAEYLLLLLKSGIPAHQDVGKWLEKMVDEFSIDDERLYDTNGDPFYLDVSVDGLVVTAKIEWATGVKIDKNLPWNEDENQRQDYKMVFTYGDTGGQSTKEYISGDDIFYKSEGIAPTIPGYEVSILLGAGAIATLGLIFVVIKKRRM